VYCWFANECFQRAKYIAQISAVMFLLLFAMKKSISLSGLEIIVLLMVEKNVNTSNTDTKK
jgi:hypothetical protein